MIKGDHAYDEDQDKQIMMIVMRTSLFLHEDPVEKWDDDV